METAVVKLDVIADGVAKITMQDKKNKNTFSDQLTEELIDTFHRVGVDTSLRAVIFTGYDNYFSSGGTQQTLLNLADGIGKFSDTNLYSLALECPIPVISAMQGHGIGGGFVIGLFADFVVLGRESVYTTNFMKYGFTPGMGATCIVPAKLGISLAEEMLLAANTYRGAELQQRGIPFPVLPRDQVMPYALELAKSLAEKPRESLVTLKDHLVAGLRRELRGVIEQEVAMHAKTFHQPVVRERIAALFSDV